MGTRELERNPRELVVALAEDVDRELVDELVSIERECCPFFDIDWQPGRQRLSFRVSRQEDEPALDAIAFALGVAR